MDKIRLTEGQTADPQKCGSCALFYRISGGVRGTCRIMPPWIKLRHTHARSEPGGLEIFENSSDPTMVYDTQACSFWRASGLTYVKERTWTVCDEEA